MKIRELFFSYNILSIIEFSAGLSHAFINRFQHFMRNM